MTFSNNHQSGSDYRIYNSGTIVRGTGETASIYPVARGDGSTFIQWNPIPLGSAGSDFRTYSTFANDSWRVNGRLTANLGLRWDKNHGKDQQGNLVAKDAAFSPRVGVVLDPFGDQKWSVTASFAQYVVGTEQRHRRLDLGWRQSSDLPVRLSRVEHQRRPDRGLARPPTPVAIHQIFDWYFANGGDKLPFLSQPDVPGVTPQIRGNLKSPNVLEYAAGLNRQFGNRAAVRADFVYRNYRDFYSERTDTSTGTVTDAFGQAYDLTLVENSNVPKRRYKGVTTQGTYRFGDGHRHRRDLHVVESLGQLQRRERGQRPDAEHHAELSRIRAGVVELPRGRPAGGPTPPRAPVDQRRRAEAAEPHGEPAADARERRAVRSEQHQCGQRKRRESDSLRREPRIPDAAGRHRAPATSTTLTAPTCRPPSRTPGSPAPAAPPATRSEPSGRSGPTSVVNYTFHIPTGRKALEVFAHADIINLFDQFQLCGCGGTVFGNANAHGGGVTQTRIDQTVRTNVSHPALYAPFNPFTTTPVQGVNWNYGPNFGKALNRFAYTTPRMFRMSFGVRF